MKPRIILTSPIGTIDRKDVYKDQVECNDNIFDCYAFINERYEVIACVTIDEHPTHDSTFQLRYMWVDEQYKLQGLGTLLIIFILRKLHKKLSINHETVCSDDIKDIILKAVETNKIKALKTKRLSKKELQKIINVPQKSNIELILEQTPVKYPLFCKDGLMAEKLLIEKENTYG